MPMSVAEMMRIEELHGPHTDPHYPRLGMMGTTPFRRYNRDTHRGGNACPLIVHWQRRIVDVGQILRIMFT